MKHTTRLTESADAFLLADVLIGFPDLCLTATVHNLDGRFWVDLHRPGNTTLIRLVVSTEGQLTVERVVDGRKEYLQEQADGTQIYLDSKPYTGTGRKLVRAQLGLAKTFGS